MQDQNQASWLSLHNVCPKGEPRCGGAQLLLLRQTRHLKAELALH